MSTHPEHGYELSDALKEIQVMLKAEAELWFKTDNSRIAEKIGTYDVAIELLITFVREQDIRSFILVFRKYQITIDNIRSCFYNTGPRVREKRNRAHRLFKTVCGKMLTLLEKESIRALANQILFDEQDAKQFFAGEYKKSSAGIEDIDLEMLV